MKNQNHRNEKIFKKFTHYSVLFPTRLNLIVPEF
ncbi:hypothetical protein CF65_00299 [Aggregatibacter actinomycetemcomitans HK1651]|nr:hypothetical protein CF65_00299 [Aggregatibacter actinomycetemcomitans HK1651]